MKYSLAFTFLALSLAKITDALPTIHPGKRDVPSVAQILNVALLVEHLESAFYQQALKRFPQSDFAAAGFPDWARGRFQQISEHEETHATFLSTALTTAGAQAVAPCEYNFDFTDVQSFIHLCAVLEAVGTAAYIGGVQFVENQDYINIAGSILAVEARHADANLFPSPFCPSNESIAWINSAMKHDNAWGTAFDAALTPSQVYTLAAPLIRSCPSSNADALPALTAYPTLTVKDASPGKIATVAFTAPATSTQLFVTFVSSVATPVLVPLHGNKVLVPDNLSGFVFCMITKDGGLADDSTTIAGPAILDFSHDSSGRAA
ncbi:ferritin-like domain-containing protein [Mycena alexandri]|uniref:Ferritin-like domain-containing protein n=1 Tax=Mycena alexandri TaxID=1745969 RepID=A0AAD6S1Q0_9AGAR|nr:ferritin-like domain-containing protein [Mycena alexandri]